MSLSKDFEEFCDAIRPTNEKLEHWMNRAKRITKKLNKVYYDNDSNEDNMFIVGSVGRGTALKKLSDYDMIFDLPKEIYTTFDSYESNGQSALLQEIKKYIKEIYPNTKVRGDGQVVVIEFVDGEIELVPGFQQSDKSFKYPDSNKGGRWKTTNPLPEISTSIQCDLDSNQNFSNLSRMLRSWKNTSGFKFKGLLIDTMVYDYFEEHTDEKATDYDSYLELFKGILKYLKDQDTNRSYWHSLGSNQQISNDDDGLFIKKARKAHKKLEDYNSSTDDINSVLRELLGNDFPKSKKAAMSDMFTSSAYTDTEEYIEDKFAVDIRYNIRIDCKVEQDGWRPASLRNMLKNRQFLKKDKKLTFEVIYESFPEYMINNIIYYWKVKNHGTEAIKRNMIRGQIKVGSKTLKESTDFNGDHYVECYAVYNNKVVAKNRIKVPIQI